MPVPESEIKLSVLILSIPSRIESLTASMNELQRQADATGKGKSVEVLAFLTIVLRQFQRREMFCLLRRVVNILRSWTMMTVSARSTSPRFCKQQKKAVEWTALLSISGAILTESQ